MNKKIKILTTPSKIADSKTDVGLLFETPSDCDYHQQSYNCIPVTKILKNPEHNRQIACQLTKKIIANEPCFRGIPQFTIFQEAISAELEKSLNIIQLHKFIVENGYTCCEFVSPSWWGDEMQKFVGLISSSLSIKTPKNAKSTSFKRCANRVYQSKFSLDTIYAEITQILKKIDPYHRRSMPLKSLSSKKISKNKSWFYSTAITYTNIGLVYEPFFPESFNYLIENPLTGGKPLKEKKRCFTNLYVFGLKNFIPKQNEIKEVSDTVYQHILSASLDNDEEIARKMLIGSEWLNRFFKEFLLYGLFSSSLFDNWIKETQPEALVTGNTGFEDYALMQARHHKIPTILLQHGVLSEYFPYSDHPVDKYIVRGQFFYERLSVESQKRALILNPSSNYPAISSNLRKKSIVFITAPFYSNSSVLNVDIESILLNIMISATESSSELIIRVHPREKIIDYKNKIISILEQSPMKIKIVYSQGEGLEQILKNASVVIIFASTVFLDCIKYKVPLIGFDWHHFSFKEKLKKLEVVNFAKNLCDLRSLIKKAIKSELKITLKEPEFFLANTSNEILTNTINNILGNNH